MNRMIYQISKRVFDIIFSLVALIIFLPFGLIIAIVLCLTGENQIFYSQRRVGRKQCEFRLLKFATMLKDSPNLGSGDITLKDDPRVLPIGRVLRKTKLNEVPQLINILKGDMSFVGPRPLTIGNFGYYTQEQKDLIVQMTPGLTGIGSLIFRDEERLIGNSKKSHDQFYEEDIVPCKALLEAWYYEHQNLIVDFLIVFATAWVVLYPKSKIYRKIWPNLPINELFR